MDKPNTTDCRPTLVERLDNIVDGYYHSSEDYNYLKIRLAALDREDEANTASARYWKRVADDVQTDDYSDLREPMQ